MLAFQKELNPTAVAKDNPKIENQPDTTAEKSKPDIEESQEYYTISNRAAQLKQSTYLLIALFAIGALCLWFMIKKTAPATAAVAQSNSAQNEQAQIEAAIARITGVRSMMFNSLEKIMNKFYEFANFEQIGVNELSKNPFRKDNSFGPLKPLDNVPTTLQNELDLLSIMETENGYCCMINDKLLYEGDTILGLAVTQITDKYVTLQNGQSHIVLRLAED